MVRIKNVRTMAVLILLAFSLMFALTLEGQWESLLRFIWREPFGEADPIFGQDIGFYLFTLPLLNLVQASLATLFFITAAAAALSYLSLEKIPLTREALAVMDRRVLLHLSLLGILFFLTQGAGYLLDRYGLFFSPQGVVYGIGYVDYHVVRVSLFVMFVSSMILAILLGANVFLRRMALLSMPVALFVALWAVSLWLLPTFIQRFIVRPNELVLETPFLKNNIAFTRKAYLLDKFRERPYAALDNLTRKDIEDNDDTIRNIRLWDWRPILQTYSQTQAIRLYYQFYEVDVDRYFIPGLGYRQVMLSGRELAEELPEKARTWVNSTLQFTHGYGLVMSFVSEFVGEGMPGYVVDNIPPVSQHLKVSQPALYYAERAPGYRIVNTGVKELDYPRGDMNVYTHYQGTGGIPMDNIWKKLLFAWDFKDINILISGYVKPSSRIQFTRNIAERIRRIAPFLELDRDPYLVLSQGRLFWIQDAYTVSKYYPYSEPYNRAGQSYIRNSVKVVMDAYTGAVGFYVFDSNDPLIKVYSKAFPGVFKGLGSFPAHLKGHIRYPEDLFSVQVDKYRTYHMTGPQVFYNREDLWALPQESYEGKQERMQPYYVLIRLPGEKTLQYIQMIPLTPQGRNNMIAWMASRSDMPWYGEVIVFKLPKERIIYGPVQVEALINQDTIISQQLSLWDQRGSRVVRGNLLVIPVNESFLYVEPVYLIGEGTNIPELKRVIMSYGGRVVMERTIEDSLNALFGVKTRQAPTATAPAAPQPLIESSLREEILSRIQEAERSLRQGDWTAFGKTMDSLKKSLSAPAEQKGPGAGDARPQ